MTITFAPLPAAWGNIPVSEDDVPQAAHGKCGGLGCSSGGCGTARVLQELKKIKCISISCLKSECQQYYD